MLLPALLGAEQIGEIIIAEPVFEAERIETFLLVSLLELSDLFIGSLLWGVLVFFQAKL